MYEDHLGWDNSVRNDCPDPYPCKNGAFKDNNTAWIRTYAGIFKCTVPVVVFLNSDVPPPYDPGEDIIGLVKDAYLSAAVPDVPESSPSSLSTVSCQACFKSGDMALLDFVWVNSAAAVVESTAHSID